MEANCKSRILRLANFLVAATFCVVVSMCRAQEAPKGWSAPPEYESNLHLLDELQGCGIHAITQVCRLGAVVKDMAKVCLAFSTGDFRPSLPQASVHGRSDIFFRNGSPETRPSGARVELCVRAEYGIVAADATIEPFVVNIVLAAERSFGALVAGYLVLQRAQLPLPFVVGLVNFLHEGGTEILPGIAELNDFYCVFVSR